MVAMPVATWMPWSEPVAEDGSRLRSRPRLVLVIAEQPVTKSTAIAMRGQPDPRGSAPVDLSVLLKRGHHGALLNQTISLPKPTRNWNRALGSGPLTGRSHPALFARSPGCRGVGAFTHPHSSIRHTHRVSKIN